MKKVFAVLPAVALALTGCSSSSDDNSVAPVPVAVTYPSDYIVTQMGEYNYSADGTLEVTKATCTDRANQYVWTKTTQRGSVTKNGDDAAQLDLGDGAGSVSYDFKAIAGETFPSGHFYKSSSLNNPLIEGVILENPYYSDVVYVNTECLFQNFGEMQETLSLIAGVPKDAVTMGCNKISIQGLEMTYTSHTETSIAYTLSYGGVSCPVTHNFLYAYNEGDCAKAFTNYQNEYESGETQEFFDFELNDQDIHACENFADLILNFHRTTGLAKSGTNPAVGKKQIKDILRAVGNGIRKRK